MTQTTTMTAARIHQYGDADVFKIDTVPVPTVGANDLLIKIEAAAVNPIDWKLRSGAQRKVVRLKLPVTLGMDVSGVVVAIGEKVKSFAVGDHVYSSPHYKRQGCYAEFVAIRETECAKKPRNITHHEAAGIPMVALTAWRCLVDIAKVKKGDNVLVTAGSGGVGSVGIQLAKSLGAHVATTCSARNIDLVKSLGADEVINYREQSVTDVLSDYDVVLDSMGEQQELRKVLRKGGRIVSITAHVPELVTKYGPYLGLIAMAFNTLKFMISSWFKGIKASHAVRHADGPALQKITGLIEAGKIKPLVDRIVPLANISDAHRYSQTGRATGKIIIDPNTRT